MQCKKNVILQPYVWDSSMNCFKSDFKLKNKDYVLFYSQLPHIKSTECIKLVKLT